MPAGTRPRAARASAVPRPVPRRARRHLEAQLGQATDAGGQGQHRLVVTVEPEHLHVTTDRQGVLHPRVVAQVGPGTSHVLGWAGALGEEHGIQHVDPAVLARQPGHDARVVGVTPAVDPECGELGVGDLVGSADQGSAGDRDHGVDALAPRGDPRPRAVDRRPGAAPRAQEQLGHRVETCGAQAMLPGRAAMAASRCARTASGMGTGRRDSRST